MSDESITVVYGEEKFFPTRFQGFTVGPISYTTKVKPDETPADAFKRAHLLLHKLADKMFTKKRNAFMDRLANLK